MKDTEPTHNKTGVKGLHKTYIKRAIVTPSDATKNTCLLSYEPDKKSGFVNLVNNERIKKVLSMKMKVTNKLLKNNFFNLYRVGYCDLQTIFSGVDADYYNAGVYGWNYDGYRSPDGDTVITTGYRNMIGERIPSELLEKYNKKASKINARYKFGDYDKKQKALEKMRRAFWAELETM